MSDGELSNAAGTGGEVTGDVDPLVGQAAIPASDLAALTAPAAAPSALRFWTLFAVAIVLSQSYYPPIDLLVQKSFPANGPQSFAGEWLWFMLRECLLAAGVLAVMYWSGQPWSAYGLKRRKLSVDIVTAFLVWFCSAAVVTVGIDLLKSLMTDLQGPAFQGFEPVLPFWFQPPRTWIGVAALLALSVAIGFSEELVFRGYLLTALETAWNSKFWSVLVSAAWFGLVHWSNGIANVWAAFLIGLVFGVFFLWTRRLWPLVMAHATIDFQYFLRIAQ